MTVDGIETNSFIAAVKKANSKHSVAIHVLGLSRGITCRCCRHTRVRKQFCFLLVLMNVTFVFKSELEKTNLRRSYSWSGKMNKSISDIGNGTRQRTRLFTPHALRCVASFAPLRAAVPQHAALT